MPKLLGAQMSGINKGQIKVLHTLVSKLGIGEDAYREMIQEAHGFSATCKDLSKDEADTIIKRLEEEAIAKGVWQKPAMTKAYGLKYEELGDRPGMASPAQLRMIEAMWKGVSIMKSPGARAMALQKFIFRICKVQEMKWLRNYHVEKIVSAIEHMKLKEGR